MYKNVKLKKQKVTSMGHSELVPESQNDIRLPHFARNDEVLAWWNNFSLRG